MIIGVFDSGIGGTTVLEKIQKLLPEEKYIYFADSKNCPYGEKSQEELEKIVSSATEYLLARGAELIVVACNTATTRTIKFLREKYPTVPFVGTEPAIKKACEETETRESETKKILLLCTEATAESKRTQELISRYKKPQQEVIVVPCPGLAKAIEDKNEEEISRILSEVSSALASGEKQRSEEIKTVILGCTHYPLIRDRIQRVFTGARLIDGGEGVAREVKREVERIKALGGGV